jgi:hypothetical protein
VIAEHLHTDFPLTDAAPAHPKGERTSRLSAATAMANTTKTK